MRRSRAELPNLLLFETLAAATGRDGITTTEVDKLKTIVTDVAEFVEPFLARISQTFKQYTEHDISHSLNLIYLMGQMLPNETRAKLNALEMTLAMLAALLHDAGM